MQPQIWHFSPDFVWVEFQNQVAMVLTDSYSNIVHHSPDKLFFWNHNFFKSLMNVEENSKYMTMKRGLFWKTKIRLSWCLKTVTLMLCYIIFKGNFLLELESVLLISIWIEVGKHKLWHFADCHDSNWVTACAWALSFGREIAHCQQEVSF